MGIQEGLGGDNTSGVSMDDLKKLEANLTSSMETQMKEMREMIAQILQASKAPASPNPEDSASAAKDIASAKSGEVKVGEGSSKDSLPKSDGGKEGYHEVPHWYSPDPPIHHPHINNRGDPPRLNASCFTNWRIIDFGFKAVDPSNMTRREVVDSQLNAIALHMIKLAVGEKDMPHIKHFTAAKEAWDALSDLFVGKESMERNIYDALSNQDEGFFMMEGEDHEDMYRRLKSIATTL